MKTFLGSLALLVSSLLIAFVLAEWLLGVVGQPPLFGYYTKALGEMEKNEWAPWWQFDTKHGVRFHPQSVQDADLSALLDQSHNWHRLSVVNPQGYHDTDSFEPIKTPEAGVLVVGDSFAWGASAAMGDSFVEVIEAEVQDLTLYNAGIPATGTEQAAVTASRWIGVLQPRLVLLAAFENDLQDNLYPLDRYARTRSGVAITQYRFDSTKGSAVRLQPEEMMTSLRRLVEQRESAWTDRSRLTRLLKSVFTEKASKQTRPVTQAELSATRRYLEQLQDTVQAQDSRLVMLLIPSRESVLQQPTPQYTALLSTASALDIQTLEPIGDLGSQHYASLPDNHWNSAGHQLVGKLLAQWLPEILDRQESTPGVSNTSQASN